MWEELEIEVQRKFYCCIFGQKRDVQEFFSSGLEIQKHKPIIIKWLQTAGYRITCVLSCI